MDKQSIAADAYVKSLMSQRDSALNALAQKEAELAQAKFELSLERSKNADNTAVKGDSGTEGGA
jgi:hypothetical protein